jgi:2-(1,2-epoxy-1,2-dihydrophenyl)acetyl-CoA isomerase
MSDVLLATVNDGIARLTMNRPETKNALDRALVLALGEQLEAVAADPAVRVVVLAGAGGAFCSGADLKAGMADPSAIQNIDRALGDYHRIIRTITAMPKPVIAMVDGPAVGFGCDLALACDLRILADRAYLQEKFVRIGLMPDGGGSLWLTRMVGVGRALEILFTGDSIAAARALELGLANQVVPPAELEPTTFALAARLAKGAPLALAAIKQAVRAALDGGLDEALAREREGQLRCIRSEDFMEGVMAWMQKREPSFKGR